MEDGKDERIQESVGSRPAVVVSGQRRECSSGQPLASEVKWASWKD